MFTKRSLSLALSGLSIFAALLALGSVRPTASLAQCGDITSTCYDCHQMVHPVCDTSEWHSVYGHRYACWNCHGGNDTAQDKDQAHVGLVANPVADAYTSCYACHPGDYQQRAELFAKEIGMPISFQEPPTRASAPLASVGTQPPIAPPTTAIPVAATSATDWRQVLWLLPLAAVLTLGWFIWRRRIL